MVIDFRALGHAAYPSSRGYPTLDHYTTDDEALYLEGWYRAQKEDQLGYSPDGRDMPS